jgi:hydroxypyruvate reductase
MLGASGGDRVAAALRANDAYPLLDDVGALVRTGPTGTNVGDLQVLLLP